MKRWLWRIAAGLTILGILIAVSGVLVVRSQWFFGYVKNRIVQEAERATGAKVEMGAFSFDWTRMRARVDNFTLHGKEAAGEPPLVQLGSATLGLRVISIFDRAVNLESLRVDQPKVRIIVYPDGSTNFPGPDTDGRKLWSEQLLNLKIGSYEVTNGAIEYDHRRIPLNLRGEGLRVRMSYDATGPSYKGDLSTSSVKVAIEDYEPMDTAIATEFVLERDRIRLAGAQLIWEGNTATFSGVLDDLRKPHGTLEVRADARVADVARQFRIPGRPAGFATFNGTLDISLEEGFDYHARGSVAGRRLRLDPIENAEVTATVDSSKTGAVLRNLTARAMGATVTGEAEIPEWRALKFKGNVADVNLRDAIRLSNTRQVPWNGILSGPIELTTSFGKDDLISRGNLTIVPAMDADPIEGHLDFAFDQVRNTLQLGSSVVATPATRLELQGTLGETLRVRARTTRLEDLLPAIEWVQNKPVELPLKLNNGSVSVDGVVTGQLTDPKFAGQVAVANGQVRDFAFDRFSATLEASSTQVSAREISGARGVTTVAGSATLTSADGTFSNPGITAQVNLRNLDVAELARQAGIAEPLAGTATAIATVTGTLDQPEATIALDVQKPSAFGESAERLRGNFRYRRGALDVTNGAVTDAATEVRFSGGFQHPPESWQSGRITFDVTTTGLPAARIERLAAFEPKLSGVLAGRVQGAGLINGGSFELRSAEANATIRQIVVDGQPIGNAVLTAQTQGTDLSVTASGTVRESRLEATGAWKLEGDAPGSATIRFSRISVASLQDLVMMERSAPPPSVEGFLEGDATINVALRRPRDFKAEVRLASLQVNPRQNPAPRLNLQPEDVILRSSGPIVLDVNAQAATVRSARFTGRNTEMDLSGTVPFNSTTGADLNIRGNIDLVILQLLRPDLQAQGTAMVNASIRGSLQNPIIGGQMSFSKAQLYLADFPNSVDNASGTILFDRRRATIQQLTAESGGGQVTFTGFVEFSDALTYRLQAQARSVRVRYPQDVSTTFNANVALNGTSEASTLSGSVVLTRSAFNLTADLGQLLAQASDPAAPDTSNEYLSGMQLDLRVQSGPNFQLETSLATDVESDVDLRIRGTPSRPVVLGSIAINRGEVQVFGNRYTVDRGDIRFLNPVKVEPRFDMDLSTRARGVTVNVTFSGTMDQFSTNYSSDPPLQSSEIFMLLAAGRDPTQTANRLTAGGAVAGNSNFAQAGNIIGQAAASQMSNFSRRFFGASRVRIDPTLTGVDNLPQARLTLEQQVSKDITFTYITNLNRTQEQIVRVQWDLSRNWSAIAVRDPSGLFGIDFQFRKRFK